MAWQMRSYIKTSLFNLLRYFTILTVAFHEVNSLFGFFILLVVFAQLISGTMIAFSYIPEPMLVPLVRDEEDLEDRYTDDFFWFHERGVDLLFIFSWAHLLRKMFLCSYEYEHEIAWKSGVFTFFILQIVTFFGLVLCCTHLSEITLTIAANIVHTFFFFSGKLYWVIFTDKTLNSDTLVRLAYAHYLSAFYMAYLGVLHGIDMHYDWKNESSYDGLEVEMAWWDEALSNEIGCFIDMLILLTIFCWIMYPDAEALSYEIFMWGDIGMSPDVRYYGVAPHWYFRPFMAWLIVCPHHKTGIFGLVYFFWVLFHQPTLHSMNEQSSYFIIKKIIFGVKVKRKVFYKNNYTQPEQSLKFQITYTIFILCCLYSASFLPYGRFYNRIGGNFAMLSSYFYIFIYLSIYWVRRPIFTEYGKYFVYNKIHYLKHARTNSRIHGRNWCFAKSRNYYNKKK